MVDCKMCNKPLRMIGLGRKNGKAINNKTGKDWTNDPNKPRLYHKKCFKIKKDNDLALLIYKTNQKASEDSE